MEESSETEESKFLNQVDPFTLESLELMRKKLLDLTARNRLLNFPITSKTTSLRIVDELPAQLSELLLSGKTMEFVAIPNPRRSELVAYGYLGVNEENGLDMLLKPQPDAREWARVLGFNIDFDLPITDGDEPENKHEDDAIQMLMFPAEMETRLRTIRNKAQTAIEEMGANILYLALGYLEWYESPDSDKGRLAPLYLIPVNLQRGQLDKAEGVYKYKLSYTGEDVLPNLSLEKKLENDFGLGLPELTDESTPESYFKALGAVIQKHQPRWSLRRYATLSLLNFSKMLMYLDLDPARWPLDDRNITKHPVVERFFKSHSEKDSSGTSEEYMIDELSDIHDYAPLIDDADSSQHSALIDSLYGKNLVIEGPPGTGKSQTITNIIGAALLNGKKILFVAEKMAALEVVKRNLDNAGLGDFCLELHSHKSQKKQVLEEIATRLTKQNQLLSSPNISAEIDRYEELKAELNSYADEINQRWSKTEKTIQEIFSGATRYRSALNIQAEEIELDNISAQAISPAKLLKLSDQVRSFVQITKQLSEQIGADAKVEEHPWYGIEDISIKFFDAESICGDLHQWQQDLQSLQSFSSDTKNELKAHATELSTLKQVEDFCEDLNSIPELTGHEDFSVIAKLTSENIAVLHAQYDLFVLIQESFLELSAVVRTEKLSVFESADQLSELAEEFSQYEFGSEVTLLDIESKADELESVGQKLAGPGQSIIALKEALPSVVSEGMGVNHEGFSNAIEIARLVSSIDPDLLRLRQELFDGEGLDNLLEEMGPLFKTLIPLREKLAEIFDLEQERGTKVLTEVIAQTSRKDLFRALSGDWRAARKTLRSFAVSSAIPIKILIKSLFEYREFLDNRKKLTALNPDKNLGELYQYLDTPLDDLQSLRNWYKDVRSVYGQGFGKSVKLGDEILSLDTSIAREIYRLNKNGVFELIESQLELLEQSVDLGSDELVGDNGEIENTVVLFRKWHEIRKSWVMDPNATIKEIESIRARLRELEQNLGQFNSNSIITSLFSDHADLETGVNKNNDQDEKIIKDSLALAKWLFAPDRTKVVVDYIVANPSPASHLKLVGIGGECKVLLESCELKYVKFKDRVGLKLEDWARSDDPSISGLITRNELATSSPQWLNEWINYIRVKKEMFDSGLGKLWQAISSGRLSLDDAEYGLSLAVYDKLSREIIKEKPHLLTVSGFTHDTTQANFQKYDKKLKELQRQRIASQVAKHNAPNGFSGGKKSDYTELSLIKNELGKKARHIPIRQLIRRSGKALLELKPCFMMGPMSAAHYLRPGQLDFDIVIMDEASQIKPEDAFGVIARGKQLVVVGDPKQLPPTSFFDRVDIDEDEDENAGVLSTDSILDAAMPLFPMRRLRWHYRSQHESLIRFSNIKFYDSDLVVFPSPNATSPEYGVKFTFVRSGRFVNQHNIEEARIVAEAVAKHADMYPGESLGVVAMSSKQREQIERAVEELCKSDTRAAAAIEQLRCLEKPFFIKNLENVQGDERDVIFISFTYGPSELGGKVFQRFGPINTDVGWRRLNVLFTRSKKRMHVFSSMKAEHIIADNHSKRGVHAMRGFLHYAETGNIDGLGTQTGKAPDSDFEIAVINALNAEGFSCEPQVGVAGFYIDIAVRDPGNPGKYLMGIECDGATYHSAKSARDRDRLRQQVLEQLGWEIHRIWSTDWFSNADAALQVIIRRLHALKSEAPSAIEITEQDAISEIEDAIESEEQLILDYVSSEEDLKSRLSRFNKEVIEKERPDTEPDKRLLRSSMIEALIDSEPISKSEFSEMIPHYLRVGTDVGEAKNYLDRVLDIIAGVEEEDI